MEKYPESVRALHEAGHEVMSHSLHHDHYNSLTADEIVTDVNASCDAIEAVTGIRPTLIRPPYGEYDDHVIAAIRSVGLEPIQWDVDVYHAAESAAVSNNCIHTGKTGLKFGRQCFGTKLRAEFAVILNRIISEYSAIIKKILHYIPIYVIIQVAWQIRRHGYVSIN